MEVVAPATFGLSLFVCLWIPVEHCAAISVYLCVDQLELLGWRRRPAKKSDVVEKNVCMYIELHRSQAIGVPSTESRPLTEVRSLRRDAWRIT